MTNQQGQRESTVPRNIITERQALGLIYNVTLSLPTYLNASPSSEELFRNFKEEFKLQNQIQSARSNFILYDRLKFKQIGTNELESLTQKITMTKNKRTTFYKQKLKELTMLRQQMILKNVQILRRLHERRKKENLILLRYFPIQRKQFHNIKTTFMATNWKTMRQKQNKKIDHLVNKHSMKVKTVSNTTDERTNTIIKKILISDIDLKKWESEKNLQPTLNYKIYGDTVLDEDEKSFASLPCEFRITEEVDLQDVHTDASKMATKLRYDQMRNNDNDNDGDDSEKDDLDHIDFTKTRVTKMKSCGRIFPPKIGRKEEELKIEFMKEILIDTTKTYLDEIKKSSKPMNLTEDQDRGRKKLMKRVDSGEIVIQISDKSKKLIIMPIEMYMKCADDHTKNDLLINWNEVRRIENIANQYSKDCCKMLGLGKDNDKRWDVTIKAVDSQPPHTHFHVKDHKEMDPDVDHPKTREITSAIDGPISRLEYITSLWFDPIANRVSNSSECKSTKSMKYSIDECNKIPVLKGNTRVVISLDIESMYPSLNKDVMMDLIYRLVRDNGDFTLNIDWKEMMTFLTKHVDLQKLKRFGLGRLIPTLRVNVNGNKVNNPTITHISFYHISHGNEITPNQTQLNKIQGLVAAELVNFLMSNHVYTVGDKIYKQTSGGPTGLDVSRILAGIAMYFFDIDLAKNIEEDNMQLNLHRRYMDDENIVVDVEDVPGVDRHVLETNISNRLKSIADQIFPNMFTVTVDFPTNHPDGKMPLLDLKVWVDHESNIIYHEHYRKPVSYRGIIWYESGIPMKMKSNIILNDGLRRLTNCSPDLDIDKKLFWLSELNLFMLQAGYNERYRRKMTNKIVGIYLNMLDKHLSGSNMYSNSMKRNKKDDKTSWFKNLGYKVAIQVPLTKNKELASRVKDKLESYSGDKILIQERLGKSVVNSLSRSNPNPSLTCHRSDCKVCISGPSKGLCYKSNVGYRIICNRAPCNSRLNMLQVDNINLIKQLNNLPSNLTVEERPAIYEGETFRSGYSRSKKQWQNYNTKSGQNKSFMYHHTNTNHGGVIGPEKGSTDYKFKITDCFRENLTRQAQEGERQTLMEKYQADNKVTVLNSKIDFCQPFRTSLAIINKSSNVKPGLPDYKETDIRPLISTEETEPQSSKPRSEDTIPTTSQYVEPQSSRVGRSSVYKETTTTTKLDKQQKLNLV